MGFKNNFSQATQNNGLKPEGDYEVLIVKIEERTNKNGKTKMNFSMVIRNDVEQAYKNGYIFHELWKRREPTAADLQVDGYGFGQVMALGQAAQLPDGKDYPNLNAFMQDLINKPVRVTLRHEKFNDREREIVSYLSPTKYPEVRHVMKTASPTGYASQQPAQYASQNNAVQAAQAAQYAPVPTDDDLPF